MSQGTGQPAEPNRAATPIRRPTRRRRDIAVRIGAFLFAGGAAISAALALPRAWRRQPA